MIHYEMSTRHVAITGRYMSTKVPFPMPQNTRTISIRRRDALRVAWRASFPLIGKIVFGVALVHLLNTIRLYGFDQLLEASTWGYGVQLFLGLGVVLCSILFMSTVFRIGRMKTLNTPTLCGFDRDFLYYVNVYGQSRIRWETFRKWKEIADFIVLFEDDRRLLIPARFWVKEELGALREVLKIKVNKSSKIRTLND